MYYLSKDLTQNTHETRIESPPEIRQNLRNYCQSFILRYRGLDLFNYSYCEIMNHLLAYQIERFVPKGESEWLDWATRVENALGHSLDGDQVANGYSLDHAYNWFRMGHIATEYIQFIKTSPSYKP